MEEEEKEEEKKMKEEEGLSSLQGLQRPVARRA
jgi:hypothetical protein